MAQVEKNTLLVSILMTAYNREKFIGEAIESVLKSSYKNIELIIVDDCSIDNTVMIAQRFAQLDSRISVHVNLQNLGQFQNRNHAASFANGKILMYVDSDDTIAPDAIAYVVLNSEANPHCKFGMISHSNESVIPFSRDPALVVKEHFFKRSSLHIGPGGTFINREFFNKLGKYPTIYGAAGDMFFNIKAASNTSVLFMPYNYLHYREHSDQELNNPYAYLYNGYLYFNDVLKLPELPLSPSERKWLAKKNKRRFLINTFRYLLKTGKITKTIGAYKTAGFGLGDIYKGIFHFN